MLATKSWQRISGESAHRDRARFRILVLDGDVVHGDDLAFALTAFGLPSCSARNSTEGRDLGDFDVLVDYTGASAEDLVVLQEASRACLVLAGRPTQRRGMSAWEARVLDWQITMALRDAHPMATRS